MTDNIVVFPSFTDPQQVRPYEMRQLVSALEQRFRGLEQNQTISVGGVELDLDDLDARYAEAAHVHTIADITDFGSYLEDITSESIFDLVDVSGTPNSNDILIWNGTEFEPVPFTVSGSTLDSLSDVNVSSPSSGEVLTYSGTEWVASAVSSSGFGSQDEFMAVDGLGVTYSLWWGAALQRLEMYNDATATTGGFWFNFQTAHAEPSIRIGQAGDADFQFQTDAGQHIFNGLYLRIYDSTDADYGEFSHDGIDFNADFVGTTDWNITGLTAIQAGTVDADFDAITATSYGGILEANLLDKTAAEAITGAWDFDNYIDMSDISAPATPGADIVRLWVQTEQGDHSVLHWMDEAGIESELGRDSMHIVRNTSGSTIPVGKAVYITGSTGQTANVSLADASDESTMNMLGITKEEIANNGFGWVLRSGDVVMDTSAWSEGDLLFASETPGELTNVEPAKPAIQLRVGTVINSNASNGILLVDIAVPSGLYAELNLNETVSGDWTFSGSLTIPEASVTAHEAALSITESQISDLQAYLLDITGESILDLADVDADPNADALAFWDDSDSAMEWITALPDSFLSSNVVLKDASNVFTQGGSGTPAIMLSGTSASSGTFKFDVTDAGTHERLTEMFGSGTGFEIRNREDSDGATETWFRMTRTGINPDEIELIADQVTLTTALLEAGNFVFDTDQTVGAGQDNYVLTYDDGSGLISLEAASGGSGSLPADPNLDSLLFWDDSDTGSETKWVQEIADSFLSSNVPLLDATNTFTAGNTFAGIVDITGQVTLTQSGAGPTTTALRFEASVPVIDFVDTDEAADEGRWLVLTNAGDFRIGPAADAGTTTASDAISIQRGTGTAVDEIELNATLLDFNGDMQVSGTTVFAGRVDIENSAPLFHLVESDAGTDEKIWRFNVNNDTMLFRAVNDAESAASTWLSVVRTGTTIDEIELNATLMDFNGDVDISGTLDVTGHATFLGTTTATARGLSLEGTAAWMTFLDTNAATNEGRWLIGTDGNAFRIHARLDADNGGTIPFDIQRGSTTTIDEIEFNATLFDFNGEADFSGNATAARMLAPAGTISAPSFAFSDDLNTGIYRPGTDQIGFTAGGSRNFRVRSTDVLVEAPMYIQEGGSAGGDIGGWGQLWVKNDTPNTFWWTDDAGSDWEIGYKDIPVNERSGSYSIVQADLGKMVYRNTSNTGVAFTMPSGLAQGYVVTIWNRNANSIVVSRSSSDTFRLVSGGGTALTSVTIPQNEMATFIKYVTTNWVVQGSAGVS